MILSSFSAVYFTAIHWNVDCSIHTWIFDKSNEGNHFWWFSLVCLCRFTIWIFFCLVGLVITLWLKFFFFAANSSSLQFPELEVDLRAMLCCFCLKLWACISCPLFFWSERVWQQIIGRFIMYINWEFWYIYMWLEKAPERPIPYMGSLSLRLISNCYGFKL